MNNYTCSACCFQMNARKQPKSCPRCGYVDASLRPKKHDFQELEPGLSKCENCGLVVENGKEELLPCR